jgi:hypothetical protein
MAVLQSEFRQARRGSGQGDLIWDRMKNNDSWDIFVSSMWGNQWTQETVPLSNEFKNALYDESQGITDIAVKLYAMTQIRVIALGHDTFRPADFRVVAAEGLGLVKPMLDALRSGDRKKIDMYGDIAPISMEDYYAAYSAILAERTGIPEKCRESPLSEQALLKLLELGVEPLEAKRLVGKVLAKHPDFRKASDVVRAAYTLYISKTGIEEESGNQSDDLRNTAGYDALKDNNSISKSEW